MMRKDQGEIKNGKTQKISERNEKRLRKEMANRLYRQFNENFLPEKWVEQNLAGRQSISHTPEKANNAEGLVFTEQVENLNSKDNTDTKTDYVPDAEFIKELERRSNYYRDTRGNFENIKHKYRHSLQGQSTTQKHNVAKKSAVKQGLARISSTMVKQQRKELQTMNQFVKNSEREYRRTHEEHPFEVSNDFGLER